MNIYKFVIVGVIGVTSLTGCAMRRSSDSELLAIKKSHQLQKKAAEREWNKKFAEEEKQIMAGIRDMEGRRRPYCRFVYKPEQEVPTVLVWLYNV